MCVIIVSTVRCLELKEISPRVLTTPLPLDRMDARRECCDAYSHEDVSLMSVSSELVWPDYDVQMC